MNMLRTALLTLILAPIMAQAQTARTATGIYQRPTNSSFILPRMNRALPLVQRLGGFHSDLVLCQIVPASEAANLREQARASLPAGQLDQFDREYNIGVQGSIIAWQAMPTARRVVYCKQILETWKMQQNQR